MSSRDQRSRLTLLLAAVLAALPWFLGLPTPAWAASPWHGPAEPSRPLLGDLEGETAAFVAITARASGVEMEQDLLLWDMQAATTVNLTPDKDDADPVASGCSPSLDGGRVAYSDAEGAVVLLDLETGVRTTVATAETDTRALGPQLQGGRVVWLALGTDDRAYAEGSYLVLHDLFSVRRPASGPRAPKSGPGGSSTAITSSTSRATVVRAGSSSTPSPPRG